MLMLSCTKVLRPGLPRIGKLGEHFVLPRTIPLAEALGALGGAIIGGLVGALFLQKAVPGGTTIFGAVAAGVLGGMFIVKWQPWKGEHIGIVTMVRARALLHTHKMTCPGGSRLPLLDEVGGQFMCKRCSLVVELKDDLVPPHEWKRRLRIGIMDVPLPQTGVIEMVSGSVDIPNEIRQKQTRKAA